MTPSDYTAALAATAARALGALGDELGTAFAVQLPGRGITTPLRLAHFLGQTCHETEGYRDMVELGDAAYFAAYDGRRDLGNDAPGDGFRYRGRGLVMLTGKSNYRTYGQALGFDLLGEPDLAAGPADAVAIAGLFWQGHGCNALADADNLDGVTRRVNGGLNGLADRAECLQRAKRALGIAD